MSTSADAVVRDLAEAEQALRATGVSQRSEGGAVRYVLPLRPASKPLRVIGFALMGFAVFCLAFMFFWLRSAWGHGPGSAGTVGRVLHLVFVLMGLPGVLAGLGMAAVGFALASNSSHTEVVVTADRLRVIEVLGLLRWPRSRPLSTIHRLVVSPFLSAGAQAASATPANPLAGLTVLVAQCARKRLLVAAGYPEAVTRRLGTAISARLVQAADRAGRPQDFPVVDVTPEGEDAVFAAAPVARPPDTRIQLTDDGERFALIIPPAGLWRGSRGLVAFAVVWNVFVLFMLKSILGTAQGSLGSILFLGLFLTVGLAMLGISVHMGYARALFACYRGRLALKRSSPFRTRERVWEAGTLAAVRVGPSNMTVNDRPVPELQLIGRDGEKTGCCSTLREEELLWMADELRRRLSVEA